MEDDVLWKIVVSAHFLNDVDIFLPQIAGPYPHLEEYTNHGQDLDPVNDGEKG